MNACNIDRCGKPIPQRRRNRHCTWAMNDHQSGTLRAVRLVELSRHLIAAQENQTWRVLLTIKIAPLQLHVLGILLLTLIELTGSLVLRAKAWAKG